MCDTFHMLAVMWPICKIKILISSTLHRREMYSSVKWKMLLAPIWPAWLKCCLHRSQSNYNNLSIYIYITITKLAFKLTLINRLYNMKNTCTLILKYLLLKILGFLNAGPSSKCLRFIFHSLWLILRIWKKIWVLCQKTNETKPSEESERDSSCSQTANQHITHTHRVSRGNFESLLIALHSIWANDMPRASSQGGASISSHITAT